MALYQSIYSMIWTDMDGNCNFSGVRGIKLQHSNFTCAENNLPVCKRDFLFFFFLCNCCGCMTWTLIVIQTKIILYLHWIHSLNMQQDFVSLEFFCMMIKINRACMHFIHYFHRSLALPAIAHILNWTICFYYRCHWKRSYSMGKRTTNPLPHIQVCIHSP